MIELIGISKSFNSKKETTNALKNISFNVNEGEVFGIVGKSGVGKSTLLKILSLQMKPDTGSLSFFGNLIDHKNNSEIKSIVRKTSYIYQNFSLLYNLSTIENVALPLKLLGVPKQVRYEKALELLKFVGLEAKKDQYPITLSGGEAQRVSIARALITEPKLLFCDEPTSALDEETAYEILNLIKDVHKKFNPTIIFVSHQIEMVKFICDRVLLLENGSIKRLDSITKSKEIEFNYESTIWGDVNV
ncbi:MAG TPA: ATP-binding cassette domain-containing protein [Acholeplasma sp.]|nr:ATP-binding cassette domain-containing protein [Acholeplasma sp.]